MKFTLLALLLFMFHNSFADTKIGVVDLQKALQSTADGKIALKEIEQDFNKKKKDFEKKESELRKLAEDLEKKKSVLSEDALTKKQNEFQQELLKYREDVAKSQIDIQKKQHDLAAPIIEKLKKITAQIGRDRGYAVIIENNPGLLYLSPGTDFTNEVIKLFEKK